MPIEQAPLPWNDGFVGEVAVGSRWHCCEEPGRLQPLPARRIAGISAVEHLPLVGTSHDRSTAMAQALIVLKWALNPPSFSNAAKSPKWRKP